MFHKLIEYILHNQNQFASGGLLLMFVGAIGASLRTIPMHLWELFLRQTTMSITMTDDTQALEWFKHWFQAHEYSKTMRRTDVFTPWSSKKYNSMLVPSPGTHWVWEGFRPLRITITRSEEKKFSSERSESLTLQTFGRNNAFLKKFLDEIREAFANTKKTTPKLYIHTTEWEEICSYTPRKLETVVIPTDIKKKVVEDIKTFLSAEEWYKDRGIPYRRCYLFHGIPGSGKTSLINGLASEFNFSVRIINPSECSDREFAKAISNVDDKSVIILEDIDCALGSEKRKPVEKTKDVGPSTPDSKMNISALDGMTLSGLLNVLDGITTPNGALFFMTSNHIEKLDPALLRAGRCDVKVYFGEATEDQKIEMYKRFFGDDSQLSSFILNNPCKSTSDFQEALVQENARRNEI